MFRRKLVDASIALAAFVLFTTAGDAISPRLAQAGFFEYCSPSPKPCPPSTGTCPACVAAPGLSGTCQYAYNAFYCARVSTYCQDPILLCSCNTDAC